MTQIELSKAEMENLIKFFNLAFIRIVQETIGVDNMMHLTSICDVYQKLETALNEDGSEDR